MFHTKLNKRILKYFYIIFIVFFSIVKICLNLLNCSEDAPISNNETEINNTPNNKISIEKKIQFYKTFSDCIMLYYDKIDEVNEEKWGMYEWYHNEFCVQDPLKDWDLLVPMSLKEIAMDLTVCTVSISASIALGITLFDIDYSLWYDNEYSRAYHTWINKITWGWDRGTYIKFIWVSFGIGFYLGHCISWVIFYAPS